MKNEISYFTENLRETQQANIHTRLNSLVLI